MSKKKVFRNEVSKSFFISKSKEKKKEEKRRKSEENSRENENTNDSDKCHFIYQASQTLSSPTEVDRNCERSSK